MMRTIRSLAIIVGVFSASPAMAQSTEARLDSRWTPWLGCWRLAQEDVRDPSSAASGALLQRARRSQQGAAEILVCVRPTSDGGVTMTTLAGGRSVLEQRIVADAAVHPVADADCRGTQQNEWSGDGHRLFTRAELACGAQSARRVSGITLFAPGPVWLDIQAINVGGNQQVRIRRYARAGERPEGAELPAEASAAAIAAAQSASTARLGVDDVIEASGKIDSQALEAALLEATSRFTLNSRELTKLGDAGVAKNVIDLMVALSFPDHFKVDRAAANGGAPLITGGGGSGMFSSAYGAYDPYGFNDPYSLYDPYGAYDPYAYYSYYSPFAYSYWGNYRGFAGSVPGRIVVPGGTSGETDAARGRAVQGRGYTRVTPGGAATSTGSASGSTTGRSSGSPASASPESGASSSPSSEGGGVSKGGYSGGGSSSSGSGRTAQPR